MTRDADDGSRRRTRPPVGRILRTTAVATVLGLIGGVVTVGFIRAFEWIQELLFTDLPDALGVNGTAWTWITPVLLVGGVVIGLARSRLGEYPVSLEQAVEDHARTGHFDDRHIWQAIVISLISLGFGASLGPEAALMAIVGGIATWVSGVIDADTAEGDAISFVGVTGAMGAMFGTAGAAAVAMDPASSDVADVRSGRIWRVIPGVAAAGAGYLVFRALSPEGSYFDVGVATHAFSWSDLAWAVPVAVVGVAVAIAFLVLVRIADRLTRPLAGKPILEGVIGAAGLAALASWSAFMLFSGHEGVHDLIVGYGSYSAGTMLLLALGKIAAAALMLSTQWKGGRFFPLMFSGAAIGLALSLEVGGIVEIVGLAAGMTAVVGVLIRRPFLAALFMVWFFPFGAWPTVVVAALIGGLAGAWFERLGAAPDSDPAPTAGPAPAT